MSRQKSKLERIIPFLEKARDVAVNPESVDLTKFREKYINLAYRIFGRGDNDIPIEVDYCFTSYFSCCMWKKNKELYDKAIAIGNRRLKRLKRIAASHQ